MRETFYRPLTLAPYQADRQADALRWVTPRAGVVLGVTTPRGGRDSIEE
ncbi:hypothetical protein ABZY57_18555 [Streptomyces sp. NPDC006450]